MSKFIENTNYSLNFKTNNEIEIRFRDDDYNQHFTIITEEDAFVINYLNRDVGKLWKILSLQHQEKQINFEIDEFGKYNIVINEPIFLKYVLKPTDKGKNDIRVNQLLKENKDLLEKLNLLQKEFDDLKNNKLTNKNSKKSTINNGFNNISLRKAIKLWSISERCAIEKYGHISEWDVSSVTNMSYLFACCRDFNEPLNKWNVSSVTNMSCMFQGKKLFNQPLDNWNVSSVINMAHMFSGATEFNQPLDKWDVSSVTCMNNMFNRATKFNQPLEHWNVSSVTSMKGMFGGAHNFNQPIEQWNVSSVTDMSEMFLYAPHFNQSLDQWNVSSVINMNTVF